MALKNFMMNNTYTRIESTQYSKQQGYIAVSLSVYTDDTCAAPVLQFSKALHPSQVAVAYTDVITEEAALLDAANIAETFKLVAVANPANTYVHTINNKLIQRTQAAGIITEQPLYILNSATQEISKLNCVKGIYEVSTAIETTQAFAAYFNGDPDKIKLMYQWLKQQAEFAHCLDA